MRYPLIWKELRESRIALLVGVVWLIGPLEFWLTYLHVKAPWPVQMVLTPAAMFASGVCMLLLGVARFAAERHTGSWEFLQTQPVPLRRAVAVKWLVPIALSVFFIAISSASAWYPVTHIETRLATMNLLQWTFMHMACAALFVSILLFIDTFDWADWLALRAIVSFALVLPFMWLMQQNFSLHLAVATAYALFAATLCAVAVIGAPYIARESLLPAWRFGPRARQKQRTPTRAWLWLQWRQVRFVFVLLMLPAPLFWVVITLPGLLSAGSLTNQLDAIRGMISDFDRVLPGLLAISAGLIGWLLPLLEAQSRADTFRWSLPFSRVRMQQLRLIHALLLVGFVFLPTLGLGMLRIMVHDTSWASLFPRLVAQLCMAAGACCAMLGLSAFVVTVQSRFFTPVAGTLAVSFLIYFIDQTLGMRSPAIPLVLITSVLAVTIGTLLLITTDHFREI